MKNRIPYLAAIIAVLALPIPAFASKRSFPDIVAESPSGRYQVEAKSPVNSDPNAPKFFQANFTYTCRDTLTNTILWTRKQAMEEPKVREAGSMLTHQSFVEPSPIDLFVSDDGWTVIYDCWHEFIVVGKQGRDRGKVDLIDEGFTRDERERYVYDTTVGPMWEGDDEYFFRNIGKELLFVTRPPWGRSVIINLEAGKLNNENANSTKIIRAEDSSRWWEDPKAVTRAIAYAASLLLIPAMIVSGILVQRRAARRRSNQQSPPA